MIFDSVRTCMYRMYIFFLRNFALFVSVENTKQ